MNLLHKVKTEQEAQIGKFADEIVPVIIPQRKGDPVVIDTDEYPGMVQLLKKWQIKTCIKGRNSYGRNASGINDSAAALIVMSKDKADELGLKYM